MNDKTRNNLRSRTPETIGRLGLARLAAIEAARDARDFRGPHGAPGSFNAARALYRVAKLRGTV